MTAQVKGSTSYADYLAREATAERKHEFVNGQVYAMAGGTLEHGALAVAIAVQVTNALAGKSCRAFSSDVRVFVPSTGSAFYPDVTVVCGRAEAAKEDPQALTNPVVVIKILSEDTEAYDRGAKAAHYRRIPSLREYVLVSQTERRIEVQRLNAHDIWELHFFGPGQRVELTALDISFPLDAVYANPLPT
jgi:Uma2 family endonuclease